MFGSDNYSTRRIPWRRKCCVSLAAVALAAIALWYWNGARSQREVWEISGGHTDLRALGCSSVEAMLATGSTDGEVRVWNLSTRQLLNKARLDEGWITNVCFSSDGRQLAVSGQTNTVHVFDAKTLDVAHVLQEETVVATITFALDDSVIVAGLWTGEVVVHDLELDTVVATFTGKWGFPGAIDLSPQENQVLIGGDKGVVAIADLRESRVIAEVKAGDGGILSLDFSPDGTMVAAGDETGNVTTWDRGLKRRQFSVKAQDYRVHSLLYLSDSVIVSAGSRSGLRFLDAQDGHLLEEISLSATGPVQCVAYCEPLHCLVVGFYHGALQVVDVSGIPGVGTTGETGP